ncbi:hypothetical protein Poly30_18930 [Planctomycetes bacterium Poly30]|uniref:DinB superfamily protein n=1 Tax=Saltatorellus ferox TaxID=2528018 RepID=A0A518EQL3_9BACT|nr:hypothetical protein Poly30_18930 [Planctomycetes bacterium Poly30]
METLFDETSPRHFTDRIQALGPDSSARWGKMNVQEMLEHCVLGVGVPLGKVVIPRRMVGRLFGWLGKRLAIDSDKPFSRNAPTDPALLMKAPSVDAGRVEALKAELIADVLELHRRGPAGMPEAPHPFFGKLTPAEWDKLSAKHLDHHLRQFGC